MIRRRTLAHRSLRRLLLEATRHFGRTRRSQGRVQVRRGLRRTPSDGLPATVADLRGVEGRSVGPDDSVEIMATTEAFMTTNRRGLLLHGSLGRPAELARPLAWNGSRDDLAALVESFPTLRRAPGVRPFDAEALDAWASGPAPSSGAFHAARLILAVYNNRAPWQCGRFDVVEAMSTWDAAHRRAFLAWAQAPWTA